MKRLKTVEPEWVTWREPGESWIKVGELVSSTGSEPGFSTVFRAGEDVQVETELLRPEPAEVTGQKLRAFADALKALETA